MLLTWESGRLIRSVHADGDTVIVLWDGRGIANDGQPYSYAWFIKMRDGKVIDHDRVSRRGVAGQLLSHYVEPERIRRNVVPLASGVTIDSVGPGELAPYFAR